MNILKLSIFEQEHSDCGVASASALANYYDSNIDYKKVQKIAFKLDSRIKNEGTSSGELGIILNKLNFRKVTIYSSNHDVVDFGWKKLSRKQIKSRLKELSIYGKKKEYREDAYWYYRFLSKRSYDNNLLVSSDFANIIRYNIDRHRPVIVDYNWCQMFDQPKLNKEGEPDCIRGDVDYHAVVVIGYDKEKVCILDSNNEKKKSDKIELISKGHYYIKWDHLMVAMGSSEVIVPDKYKR